MEAKGPPLPAAPPPAKALPTPSRNPPTSSHRESMPSKPAPLQLPPEGSAPYVLTIPIASTLRQKLDTPPESSRQEPTLSEKLDQMPIAPPLGASSPDSKSCWPFGGKAKRRRREREEREAKERQWEQRRANEEARRAQENASVLQALKQLTVSVGLIDAEVQRLDSKLESLPSSADSEAERAKAAFFADEEKQKQKDLEKQIVETEKALGKVLEGYHPTLEHTVNMAVANAVKDVQKVSKSVEDIKKALDSNQQSMKKFMVEKQSDLEHTVQVAVSKAMQNVQKTIATQLKERDKDMAQPPAPVHEVKVKFERAIQTEPEIDATPRKPPAASVIKVGKGSSTPTFSRSQSTPTRDNTPRGNAPRVMAFQACDCGYKGAEDRVKSTGPHHNKHCSSYRVDICNNENEMINYIKEPSEPPVTTVAPTPTRGYTEEESVQSALMDPACSASLVMIPDLQMRNDEAVVQSPNRGPFAPSRTGNSHAPTPIRYPGSGEKPDASRNKPQCIVPVSFRQSGEKGGSAPQSANRVPFGVVQHNVEDDVTVRRPTSNFPNASRPLEFAM